MSVADAMMKSQCTLRRKPSSEHTFCSNCRGVACDLGAHSGSTPRAAKRSWIWPTSSRPTDGMRVPELRKGITESTELAESRIAPTLAARHSKSRLQQMPPEGVCTCLPCSAERPRKRARRARWSRCARTESTSSGLQPRRRAAFARSLEVCTSHAYPLLSLQREMYGDYFRFSVIQNRRRSSEQQIPAPGVSL